jgi:mannose-6-phosphate isomerase-like protein (cupin superfamily)
MAIRRVEKPWGYELIWAHTGDYVGKILHINRGHRLSLQYHVKKDETFLLYSGRMILVFENDAGELQETELSAGAAHRVPPGRRHRMIAVEDCEVFEVSTPELDDVVRVEDVYGRAGTSRP